MTDRIGWHVRRHQWYKIIENAVFLPIFHLVNRVDFYTEN